MNLTYALLIAAACVIAALTVAALAGCPDPVNPHWARGAHEVRR